MQIQQPFLSQSETSSTGPAAYLTAKTGPEARFLPTMITTSISVTPLLYIYSIAIYIYIYSVAIYIYIDECVCVCMYTCKCECVLSSLKPLRMQICSQERWEDAEGRLKRKQGRTVLPAFLRQSPFGLFFFLPVTNEMPMPIAMGVLKNN